MDQRWTETRRPEDRKSFEVEIAWDLSYNSLANDGEEAEGNRRQDRLHSPKVFHLASTAPMACAGELIDDEESRPNVWQEVQRVDHVETSVVFIVTGSRHRIPQPNPARGIHLIFSRDSVNEVYKLGLSKPYHQITIGWIVRMHSPP